MKVRSESTTKQPPIVPGGSRIVVFCWVSAVVSGALYFWNFRNVLDPDEISYLDIADAYSRGDWTNAINSQWSPLYSWVLGGGMALLRPSPKWEFLFLCLVAFLFYLASLWAFHMFWRQIDGYKDTVLTLFGYSLFLWAAMDIARSEGLQPDIGVMAIVYSVAALYLRIERSPTVKLAILLGATLACGYLLKAVMFPLSLVFLVLLFCGTRSKQATAAAAGIFVLVSAPWIITLSLAKHRLTYSDAGTLNYAFYANGVKPYTGWYGGPGASGSPVHPPALVHTSPRVMAYAVPVAGTYPLWYDPTYWYEGVHLYFNPREQIVAIAKSTHFYWKLLLGMDPEVRPIESTAGPTGALLGGCIALSVAAGRWLRIKPGLLVLWTLTAFALYALVHVEFRYIGGFVVLFWAIAYRTFREGVRRDIGSPVVLVVAVALASSVVALLPKIVIQTALEARSFITKEGIAPDQYKIVQRLSTVGLIAGEPIASVGAPFNCYFARLGRLKFVAEVMDDDVELFWRLDEQRKAEVFRSMASTGARAVIAKRVPVPERSDWISLGDSGYYVHTLDETRPLKRPY